MRLSLTARLLVAASCVLVVFVVFAGAGLDQAFVQSALQSQRDRSQATVFAILSVAEPGPRGRLMVPATALPDPRLTRIQSGLEAVIFDAQGTAVWHSPNLSDPLPPVQAPPVGDSLLTQIDSRFVFSYGVRWYGNTHHPERYTVALIEDETNYRAQLHAFRRTLWTALAISAGALLLLQLLLLRWSLSPLRHLANEVQAIETGTRDEIKGVYPQELTPLARNLNAMIRAERSQMARYRNALGDLAHSLKTPLAVLRGVADASDTPAELATQIDQPVSRMEDIAGYQLRRAATAGHRVLSQPVALGELTDKILSALNKVYADKHLELRSEIPADLRLRADEGDLYEILGNFVDNACKWARHEIVVSAASGAEATISVEDDGPGFPDDAARLAARGARADTRVAGQGIGLATVHDIVALSGGTLEFGRSTRLGGGCITARWTA